VKQLVWATALIVAASISAAANAATPVGAVSRVRGECVGLSEGMTRALDAGAAVHLAEEISTGKAARLEIKFDDGTILTLGEHARLVIDSFVYNPADGLDELIVSATGSFRFVSGALKSEASTIRVETPLSLIGVRGTDFWGGPINDRYGVFLPTRAKSSPGAASARMPGSSRSPTSSARKNRCTYFGLSLCPANGLPAITASSQGILPFDAGGNWPQQARQQARQVPQGRYDRPQPAFHGQDRQPGEVDR